MSKPYLTPDVLRDGRPVRGRSTQRTDGSYKSYDLDTAVPGDIMTIITNQGAHELVKVDADRALEGWQYADQAKALGAAVRLTLHEPNEKGGTSFLTPGIVVREGLEVGVVELKPGEEPSIARSLGRVASILHNQPLPIESTDKIAIKGAS